MTAATEVINARMDDVREECSDEEEKDESFKIPTTSSNVQEWLEYYKSCYSLMKDQQELLKEIVIDIHNMSVNRDEVGKYSLEIDDSDWYSR